MKLCLSCRTLWPGDALYCGSCKRTFGGRRCRNGHLNPPEASVCTTCGKGHLSTYTGHLGLGWAMRLLAWGIAFLLIRLMLTNIGSVAALLSLVTRPLTGHSAAALVAGLFGTLLNLLPALLLIHVLCGGKTKIPHLIGRFVTAIAKAALGLIRLAVKGLTLAVEGSPPKGGKRP